MSGKPAAPLNCFSSFVDPAFDQQPSKKKVGTSEHPDDGGEVVECLFWISGCLDLGFLAVALPDRLVQHAWLIFDGRVLGLS